MKKNLMKNLQNLIYIAINNLKKENKGASLGAVWLLINPIVEAAVYAVIFGFLYGGEVNGISKVPWIIIGSFTWTYLAGAFLTSMDSFYLNRMLVTKLKFSLDSIPVIHIIMEQLRYFLLFIIMIPILIFYKIYPSWNYLFLIYAFIASNAFLVSASKLFSTLSTIVKDAGKIVRALFGALFWLSGVVLNLDDIKSTYHLIYVIAKLNPFSYLVNLWRDVLLNTNIFTTGVYTYHIAFWLITLLLYITGKVIFKKFKGDFADII